MKNFESNLERLEQLSENIKRSNITLEEALKSFEEGIKLAKGMEKELDSIEGRIQILMNGDSLPEEKKSSKKTTGTEEEPVLDLFSGTTELNGTRA